MGPWHNRCTKLLRAPDLRAAPEECAPGFRWPRCWSSGYATAITATLSVGSNTITATIKDHLDGRVSSETETGYGELAASLSRHDPDLHRQQGPRTHVTQFPAGTPGSAYHRGADHRVGPFLCDTHHRIHTWDILRR